MKIHSQIELLLLVAAFCVVLIVDATATKLWISLPCLVVVFIIEKIRKKQLDEQTVSENLKNFSSARLRRQMGAEDREQYYRS